MAFTPVAVSATYTTPTGQPSIGNVVFQPTDELLQAGGPIIPAKAVSVPLVNGALTVELFATDDPATRPPGQGYIVTEQIGSEPWNEYVVAVPHIGGPTNLSSLAKINVAVVTYPFPPPNQDANAISIQGIPVTGTLPVSGQVLGFKAGIIQWLTISGGSGGAGNATSIQGIPVSAVSPTDGETLVYSSSLAAYVPAPGGGDFVPLNDVTNGFNGSYWMPAATGTASIDTAALLACLTALGATVTGNATIGYTATGARGVILFRYTGATTYVFYPVMIDGPALGMSGPGSVMCEFEPVSGMSGTSGTNTILLNFTDSSFTGNTGAGILTGFRISGTNAGNFATGIELGDRVGQIIGDVQVNNFGGTGSIGWDLHNRFGWCERATATLIANANTRNYVVHSEVGSGSFEYSGVWNFTFTALANQNGIEFIGSHGPNFTGSDVGIRGNCLAGTSNTGVGVTFGPNAAGVWGLDIRMEVDTGTGTVGHQSFSFDPATHVQGQGGVIRCISTNGLHWQPSNYGTADPDFYFDGPISVDNDPILGQLPFGIVHSFLGGWAETTVPFTGGQIPITLGNIFTTTLTNGVNNLAFVGQRTDTASFSAASSTITDTAIGAGDAGKLAVHPNFPPPSFVGTVTPGSHFLLSSLPFTQVNATPLGTGTSAIIGGVTPLGRAGRYRFMLVQPASGSNPGTLGTVPFTWIGSSALSPSFGDIDVVEAFTIDGVQFFAYVVPTANNTPQAFQPVQVCSITNIASLATLLAIDGYTLQYNDPVLLLNQTDPRQNGIWLARTGGWARPGYFGSGTAINSGAVVNVAGGTARFNSAWMLEGNGTLATGSIVIDTDNQVWVNRNPGPSRLMFKQARSVALGVSGGAGATSNWNPDGAAVGVLPMIVVVVWGGTFAGGETATLTLTADYSDSSSPTSVTQSATTTSAGTSLGQVAIANLMKDGVYITKLTATATTTAGSTAVTCTPTVSGQNVN